MQTMVSRADRIVAVETVSLGGALGVVHFVDATALWLLWAVVTVAAAGATLVAFNWGLDPPTAE